MNHKIFGAEISDIALQPHSSCIYDFSIENLSVSKFDVLLPQSFANWLMKKICGQPLSNSFTCFFESICAASTLTPSLLMTSPIAMLTRYLLCSSSKRGSMELSYILLRTFLSAASALILRCDSSLCCVCVTNCCSFPCRIESRLLTNVLLTCMLKACLYSFRLKCDTNISRVAMAIPHEVVSITMSLQMPLNVPAL